MSIYFTESIFCFIHNSIFEDALELGHTIRPCNTKPLSICKSTSYILDSYAAEATYSRGLNIIF